MIEVLKVVRPSCLLKLKS